MDKNLLSSTSQKNLFNCTILRKSSYLLFYPRYTSIRITKSRNDQTNCNLPKKKKLIVNYIFERWHVHIGMKQITIEEGI